MVVGFLTYLRFFTTKPKFVFAFLQLQLQTQLLFLESSRLLLEIAFTLSPRELYWLRVVWVYLESVNMQYPLHAAFVQWAVNSVTSCYTFVQWAGIGVWIPFIYVKLRLAYRNILLGIMPI